LLFEQAVNEMRIERRGRQAKGKEGEEKWGEGFTYLSSIKASFKYREFLIGMLKLVDV